MRSRTVAYGCLLLGGLLAIVATAQPWWRANGAGVQVSFKGSEATGGLSQALSVVALAGTLLVLVMKTRGRQAVAVLLAIAGSALAIVGALRLRPDSAAVRTRMRQVSLIDQYALTPTVWPWIFALAGALLLVGAVVMLLRAAHWPVPSDRFQRQPSAQVANLADDPAGVWKALDAGFDPTSDSRDRDTPDNSDPNVHIRGAGDTMVAKQSDQAQESGQGQHSDQGQADQPARSGQSTSSPE
jgi:uncharacterized membrane protein (TIGR02234 family)